MQTATAPVDYEFSDEENHHINTCSDRARLWGIICIIAGILQGIVGLLNLVGAVSGNGALFLIPMGVYNLVLGSTFLGAAKMLKAVVTTEGNDIVLMMSAVRQLSSAFRIQIIATVVATVLIIGFFLVGMMAISAMMSG